VSAISFPSRQNRSATGAGCLPGFRGLCSGFPRLNLNQIPYFFHTFSNRDLKKKKKLKKNFLAPILNRRQKILTAVKKFNEKLKFPYLFKKNTAIPY
jgi:hypothetical protein